MSVAPEVRALAERWRAARDESDVLMRQIVDQDGGTLDMALAGEEARRREQRLEAEWKHLVWNHPLPPDEPI